MLQKLNLHQSSVIGFTINRTALATPTHQFNIIRCLTMRKIYIPNAFNNKWNQQCNFFHFSSLIKWCSASELCSIIVNYTIYGFKNIYGIHWMNSDANANSKFRKALSIRYGKCFEVKLKLLKRFPDRSFTSQKALFSNACRTNPDQPKSATNDDWLKGESTSVGIAKRDAFESFIYESFDGM